MGRPTFQHGFTLLELLVVLAVLGALLGLVSFSYQVDSDKELLQKKASELKLFLQHKVDQAWMEGITYGLEIKSKSIVLKRLEEDEWQDTESEWDLDEDEMELDLVPVSSELQSQTASPSEETLELLKKVDLVLVSSGEYTPFEIRLRPDPLKASLDGPYATVKGDGVNALQAIVQ